MSVTLKELRISKGLNQAQCAEYLGMSTRNYQNYENDAAKANTARYHAIYQKLESYGQPVVTAAVPSQMPEFHTNVVTGAGLQALANSVAKYGKRDCFSTLQKFVNGSYDGKICILYGLRRTGKTTLLFQMLSELPIEKTASTTSVGVPSGTTSSTLPDCRLRSCAFTVICFSVAALVPKA